MKKIDFSSKHEIYIRNFDGTYQPMDEPFFQAEEVAPNTWKVLSDGDYSYVVAGDTQAVVIDSGYGAGNIREFCQTLTDKPIHAIVNTHHHFDHTANNCYFDLVYMDAKAKALATIPYPSFEGIVFPRDYKVETVSDGYIIDLGGRTLEVFQLPDHTDDGICLLDRKAHLLFTGDEFMNSKNLSGSVEHWKQCLDKLMPYRRLFEQLCAGEGILPASIVDKQYKITELVLGGKEGEDMPEHGGPGGFRGPGGPGGPGGSGIPGGPEGPGGSAGSGVPGGFGGPGAHGALPAPNGLPFDPMHPEIYDGHKVYYRKFPHPEDVHKTPRFTQGKMKKLEWDGYRLMYDCTNIFNSSEKNNRPV